MDGHRAELVRVREAAAAELTQARPCSLRSTLNRHAVCCVHKALSQKDISSEWIAHFTSPCTEAALLELALLGARLSRKIKEIWMPCVWCALSRCPVVHSYSASFLFFNSLMALSCLRRRCWTHASMQRRPLPRQTRRPRAT